MPEANTVTAPIEGSCDPRFGAVREAFVANFADEDEVGAAVCIHVDGHCVVDLWGGYADASRQRVWQRDTVVNAYSVGKGVLAILVASVVERGELDLDARVSDYWPEYSAGGKGETRVRTLLSHAAGMPAVRERLPDAAAYDWEVMCAALASQAPWWEPGTAHGYHVNTYGFLVGEVLRRATGQRVGEALAERIARPLGADFWYGLPAAHHPRVADVVVPFAEVPDESHWALAFPPTGDAEHDRMIRHTYFNPASVSGVGSVNTPEWRRSVIPSTSGHGSARGVAAMYAAFLAGGPGGRGWAGPGVRAEATRTQVDGDDRVLKRPSRFGLGFQLAQPSRPIGPNPNAFGHFGYGGSLGFADPDARVGFGYLMNRPGERWQTPRVTRLIDSLYTCL